MNKKHWKITLISILITSTLFNTPNEIFADTGDDIDEDYQEEDHKDDAAESSADDVEVNTDDSYEDENMPEEEGAEAPLYDGAEARVLEDDKVLLPAEPVEERDSAELQEEPAEEGPATAQFTEPEDGGLDEGSEPAVDENDGDGGQPVEDTSPVNDEEVPVDENDEILEGQESDEQDPSENEMPMQPEESEETGQPSQTQPEQNDPYETESDEQMNNQPEMPAEATGEESVENHEYYGGPEEEQPSQMEDRNVQEYAFEDADEEVSEEVRSNAAGKKLYRYNYGDILNGLNFSPGNSDESLALLDKRVNRIMTSKILEEDELSEEEIFSLEEEIKNETSNASSDRESLPNTGDANNYSHLYSLMLVLAGGILFFITKKPRQQ